MGHRKSLNEVWKVYGDSRGVIGGHLYEVWKVYGVDGVIYMRFEKCMGTIGVHCRPFI